MVVTVFLVLKFFETKEQNGSLLRMLCSIIHSTLLRKTFLDMLERLLGRFSCSMIFTTLYTSELFRPGICDPRSRRMNFENLLEDVVTFFLSWSLLEVSLFGGAVCLITGVVDMAWL